MRQGSGRPLRQMCGDASPQPLHRVRKRGDDAAQFGEALQAPDGGIARLRRAAEVIKDVLAVIRVEGDRDIGPSLRLAAALRECLNFCVRGGLSFIE